MIQILYTDDHASRGTALAGANGGARHGLLATTVPVAVPGLDTLTMWGHGDQWKFCDLTAADVVRKVAAWKALNPAIRTLEIITCNARHCVSGDPIANQIKSGLRAGFLNPCRDINVKALPLTVTGKRNAWSILLAETTYRSWVYVTAPGADDKLLMQAQNLVRFVEGPRGASSFKGDMADRANKVVRDHPARQWTMNYGYFNTLRANLVSV